VPAKQQVLQVPAKQQAGTVETAGTKPVAPAKQQSQRPKLVPAKQQSPYRKLLTTAKPNGCRDTGAGGPGEDGPPAHPGAGGADANMHQRFESRRRPITTEYEESTWMG
jgi:hypothetical protein